MKPDLIGRLALAAGFVLAATASSAQNLSEAAQQLMVENLIEADANADGALNRSEFAVLVNLNAEDGFGGAALIVRTGRYDRAFGRIDANGDGFVTGPELQAMAQQVQG